MLKGNFPIVDVVRALDNNAGNEDVALLELQKNQLKPFLMRIWGPPAGVENDEVAPRAGKFLFNFFNTEKINLNIILFISIEFCF